MKKIFLIIFAIPLMVFSQEEKLNFTKKIEYFLGGGSTTNDISVYYSKDGLLIDEFQNKKMLVKSGKLLSINLDLDHKASSNLYGTYENIPSISLKKTNKTDVVGLYKCVYYDVVMGGIENMQMCITQDPALDLMKFFKSEDKTVVSGFPLIVKNYGSNMFIFKSMANYSNSIKGDFTEMIATLEENKEDYCDDVAVEEDTVDYGDAAFPAISDFLPYESTYKKTTGDSDFAIDYLESDSYLWKSMPAYCTDLDSSVPDFSNKKLTKRTKNYAGQICDMYLSLSDRERVAEKETLDVIRFETEYFIKNKSKFSKKDQKLLDDFLNTLD